MIENFLIELAKLSNKYGTGEYVKGGGGNTSYKDETTLWIKPSGTILATIKPEDFIPLDRNALQKILYEKIPQDPTAREAAVKELMLNAVKQGFSGRPSVEALLHNVLNKNFVLHIHPAIVNGMTCAIAGKRAASRLFPDALWIPYVDPGYTLSKTVFEAINEYKNIKKREPDVLFLENHGIFIAENSTSEVSKITENIIRTIEKEYQKADISINVDFGKMPSNNILEETYSTIRDLLKENASHIAHAPPCPVAEGPLTPDHIVYAKSFIFTDELNENNLNNFKEKYGYFPRVMALQTGVFAIGSSQKAAELALELALDGALIKKLANAFGGVKYLTNEQRLFIENWEVEAYRSSQIK